jgi:hypothetical protein
MERNIVTQRIAVGLTLLAALLATACGDDPRPQSAEPTLVFRAQPGEVRAGEKLGVVEVALVDAEGRVVVEQGGTVELSLADAPAGARLGGVTRSALERGVARFPHLTVEKAAVNMKLAARVGARTTSSAAFTVRPGAPARMAVVRVPTDVEAGGALGPVVVHVQDAFGNTVDEDVTVTVALEGGTAGATLSGNTSVRAVNGVATFDALPISQEGTGYVLSFSSDALPVVRSSAFLVNPSVPSRLRFTQQPAESTVAGATLAPVRVAVLDNNGNVATTARGIISLELVSNNGATLRGTTAVAVANGVATFYTLNIQRAGAGYTLRARFGTLPTVESTPFTITPAAATRLAYVTPPGAATAGAAFSPAVQVELLDTYGNRAASSATVEVALAANPGGATLNGTRSVSAVAGLATFADLSLDVAGQGYSLSVSSAGLATVTSGTFNVAAAAIASLAFTTQPVDTPAGEGQAVQVIARDAFGNVVTAATDTVSLALGNNPGEATLSGTTQVALSNGTASFPGVVVDRAGTGYTLAAAVGGVAATSNAFNVSPAAASLAFVAAPGNITAGNAFNPVVVVEVRDADGNRVPSRATVGLRLATNPTGAALVGTASVAAVNGQATFTGLTMQRAGTGYTVEASAGTLPAVTSAAFNVLPAAVLEYVVATQPPETAVAGESLGTIRVEARDRFGNLVTSYGSAGERIAVGVDPGLNPAGAGVVAGVREVLAVGGVATFQGLALDRVGATQLLFVGYNANFTLLYTGYSRAVNITPAAASAMAFGPVAAETQAGSAIGPAVQVRVTDRFGNPTSGSGEVTLALGANPGGSTLQGTLTQPVTNGVATFPDLRLEKAGRGYTLKASQTGLTPATSAPFAILGAEPTRLEFAAQPRSTPNGLPLNEVAVRLLDAFGNTATSASEVTLALGNANGAVLGGTVRVAARDGVARFADLTVDRNGEDYTLAASAGSLLDAESLPFDVYGASLAYTDPAAGRLRLLRNPASTSTRLVLDLVAAEELTGYGAGFNLPLDATKVRLPAQGALTAGAILSVGSGVPAVAVALPGSGPLAGVLTSGISQKAAGSGSVASDTAIPAGSVLYQVALELAPGAEPGVVFDGASLGNRFKGLLRNKLGDDVVGSSDFGIGRLEVAADAGFQQTARR